MPLRIAGSEHVAQLLTDTCHGGLPDTAVTCDIPGRAAVRCPIIESLEISPLQGCMHATETRTSRAGLAGEGRAARSRECRQQNAGNREPGEAPLRHAGASGQLWIASARAQLARASAPAVSPRASSNGPISGGLP